MLKSNLCQRVAHLSSAGIVTCALATAFPAHALVINTTFDNTITALANASQVESAFNIAAAVYAKAFTNPVTVNITVSWGQIAGTALPANAIGASADPLKTSVSYSVLQTALLRNAAAGPGLPGYTLPTTSPAGNSGFDVAYANALALGLTVPGRSTVDGYIGFAGVASNYTFSEAAGIAANTYDFVAVAEHEIAEVLGRTSAVNGTNPAFHSPLDLFRYTSPGVLNFSTTTPGYFSIDGGITNLGTFNSRSAGGDRTDWAGATGDVQNAFGFLGQAESVTALDLTVLNAIGWTLAPVPEPGQDSMLLAGLALLGRYARRRSMTA